jgi:phenylalanyl-tRNA synthetase beta chain
MRISVDWLKEWVPLEDSATALGQRLTMAGLELDAIAPVAGAFTHVRVGRVEQVEPHPDAERLRVCRVAVGQEEPLTIVCGAPNVRAGLHAPVALVGAQLPGGLRIRKSRLRGVESCGMLCSGKELGLHEDASGLLELPDTAPVGEDLRTWMRLDDEILEVDLTPNRADCLSLLGIAREVGVLLDLPVHMPEISPVEPTTTRSVTVTVAAPEACPFYAARVIEDLQPDATTPLWMAERLRRAGLRPLHPVVDVTNYLMLELGQPMHAFAAEAVGSEIFVRFPADAQPLPLLNGQTITPGPEDLLITQASAPLALAGIMGGSQSAVTASTRNILLEAAHFTPRALAGRARAHGLHTDASHRFERGVDPALPLYAMERATALILQIAGGRPGPVVSVGEIPTAHVQTPIVLRQERIPRLLGETFAAVAIERILRGLGCRVEPLSEDRWAVYPLRARFDLAREEDLIEELARIHGYERLPQTLPKARSPVASGGREALRARQRELVAHGFHEVITFSFIAPAWAQAFYPDVEPLPLANPLSADLAVMRPGLWPGLVRTAAHNLARQQPDLRLFEYGQRFLPGAMGLLQDARFAGLMCGRGGPEHWQAATPPVDFFAIKAMVETLCAHLPGPLRFLPDRHPALHDGQSARVEWRDQTLGWVGALHPRLQEQLEVPELFLFELAAEPLLQPALPRCQPLSAYPSIRRDLAVVVEESVPAGALLAEIAALQLPLLQQTVLFDVYRSPQLGEQKKSIAIGLILRAFDRTLAEADGDAVMARVMEHLEARLGAQSRA